MAPCNLGSMKGESMRSLAGMVLIAAASLAAPAFAQELVTGGERAPAPAAAAPRPIVPPEHVARDEANALWAQNILDGKPNISPEDAERQRLSCPPANTPVHGEVRVAVGSGGYKSTGVTMVKPISGCGQVAVSVDWSDGGNQGRRYRSR